MSKNIDILDYHPADLVPVTPSDTQDLPRGVCLYLKTTAGGQIQVTTLKGQVRIIPIPAGATQGLPLKVRRVWQTNTTIPAGNIFAAYQPGGN